MEQNEEVLVRVYQEKERQYRDQMNDLRQKLQASQQGEAALRQQLRQADEQRQDLQRGFDALSDEKSNLQKKCQQIERELYTIRNRFEDFVRDTKAAQAAATRKTSCENCQRKPQIVYENGSIGTAASGKAPIPAPRQNKDTVDRQLRSEVDDLRGEISSLRDQLNTQMQMFTEERCRWEQERKVWHTQTSNSQKLIVAFRFRIVLPPPKHNSVMRPRTKESPFYFQMTASFNSFIFKNFQFSFFCAIALGISISQIICLMFKR